LFFKHLIKWTVRHSDHFLCNSDFTASELRRCIKLPHDNVTVTRLAPAVNGLADDLPASEERDGFLCVGAIEPRKNQLLMLDAYNEAVKKNPVLPGLTIIGPDRGDGAALKQKIVSYGLAEKVKWMTYVPVEALAEYYRSAKIFVFPSMYEGFGLPLLEAMRYRLPVVCGDIPVLREVGGNYPLYIAPKKLSAWVEAFLNYKELEPGCEPEERLSEFSWRRCAEQTLKIYDSVKRK
jgi:glycosyltransferase involved in cell wall biosynthesis